MWFLGYKVRICAKCNIRSYDVCVMIPRGTEQFAKNNFGVASIKRDFPKWQASAVSVILHVFLMKS